MNTAEAGGGKPVTGSISPNQRIIAEAHRDLHLARLPETYTSAVAALKEAVRVDEVKDWRDKWEALRAYARQQNDTEAEEQCKRLKLRATRRIGELLAEFDARGGDSSAASKKPGPGPFAQKPIGRQEAASSVGLSRRQAKDATALAKVPEEEFEEQAEQTPVPTAAAILAKPKEEREPEVRPALAAALREVTHEMIHGWGALEAFAAACARYPAETALAGLGREPKRLRKTEAFLRVVDEWMASARSVTKAEAAVAARKAAPDERA